MTSMTRRILAGTLMLCVGVAARPAPAEKKAPPPPERPATQASPAPTAPLYVPPSRPARRTRVGGGTRGEGGAPSHFVLAPDHTALTTRAQPTLYWFAERAPGARVEFTLVDERFTEPKLEIALEGPIAAGLHAVALADHAVTLEPGVPYRWFIALVPDPRERASDILSGGVIERREPGAELTHDLEATGAAQEWAVYARHGIWHDALDSLARRLRADPADAQLLDARARLLAEVGLPPLPASAR